MKEKFYSNSGQILISGIPWRSYGVWRKLRGNSSRELYEGLKIDILYGKKECHKIY
jgi:hypothetical protein